MKRYFRPSDTEGENSAINLDDEDLRIFLHYDSENETLKEEEPLPVEDHQHNLLMNRNNTTKKRKPNHIFECVDIFSQLTNDIFAHEIFQYLSLKFVLSSLRLVSKHANQVVLSYVLTFEFPLFFYPDLSAEKDHELVHGANIYLSDIPSNSTKDYLSLFENARRLFCNQGHGILYHLRDVNFSRLEALYFYDCSLDFTSVKYILKGSLLYVKFICFLVNRLGDDGARAVVEKLGHQLIGLAITNDCLTDRAAEFMISTALPSLTYLNLSNNSISETGFQQVLDISSLKILSIAFNDMNGDEISKGRCKLKFLNVAGNTFDYESLEDFSKIIYLSTDQNFVYGLNNHEYNGIIDNCIPDLFPMQLRELKYDKQAKGTVYYTQFMRCIKLNRILEANFFKKQSIINLKASQTPKTQYLIGKMHVLTKDYQKALAVLKNCLYRDAYYEIAELYFHGKGTEKDYSEALSYYLEYKNYKKKDHNSNKLPTNYQIGYCYYKEEGLKKAKLHLQKSKDNRRNKILGKIYYRENEFQLAYSYLKQCDTGASAYLLSKMFQKGKGVDVSLEKAYHYLLIAVGRRYSKAFYRLGKWYERGMSPILEKDIYKAIYYYDLARFRKSFYRLGMLYYHGEYGIEVNFNKAKHYLTQLPENCSILDAWICLGRIYQAENDMESAYIPYSRAASLGHKLVNRVIGEIDYYNGKYKSALSHLTKYLNEDEFCERVALKIARIYYHHTKDLQKSLTSYQIVDHLPEAQAAIGVFYSSLDDEDRKSIPYGQEKILNFLKMAAEHGYSQAQYHLALKYLEEKNAEQSLFWMKKAFETGSISRFELFTLCMKMGNIEQALYQLQHISNYSLSFFQKETITSHLYNAQQYNALMDWVHALPNHDELMNNKICLMFIKGQGVPKDLMKAIDILLFTFTNYLEYSELCQYLKSELNVQQLDKTSIEYALLKLIELQTAKVSREYIPFLFMKVLYQNNFSEYALKLLETRMQGTRERALRHIIHNDPLMAIHELLDPITHGILSYSLEETLNNFRDLCSTNEILKLFMNNQHQFKDSGHPMDKMAYEMFKNVGMEETGIDYLDRIAMTGNSFKKHEVATIYEYHLNNFSKAMYWYEQSGLPQSMYMISEMYRIGKGPVCKNVKKSVEILECIINNLTQQQIDYGYTLFYLASQCAKENGGLAIKFLERAIENGYGQTARHEKLRIASLYETLDMLEKAEQYYSDAIPFKNASEKFERLKKRKMTSNSQSSDVKKEETERFGDLILDVEE
nr:unnamed protein product [Naegleria fowleri]